MHPYIPILSRVRLLSCATRPKLLTLESSDRTLDDLPVPDQWVPAFHDVDRPLDGPMPLLERLDVLHVDGQEGFHDIEVVSATLTCLIPMATICFERCVAFRTEAGQGEVIQRIYGVHGAPEWIRTTTFLFLKQATPAVGLRGLKYIIEGTGGTGGTCTLKCPIKSRRLCYYSFSPFKASGFRCPRLESNQLPRFKRAVQSQSVHGGRV